MAVVTPYGDFRLDDDVALEMWLAAHNRRHMAYAMKFRVPGGSLEGPVDGDWMYRHAARHVTLATLIKWPLGDAATKALALPDKWETEQQLLDWHALHSRLHVYIERVRVWGAPPAQPLPPVLPPDYGIPPARPPGQGRPPVQIP